MTEQRPVRERLRGLAERHRADRPWAGTTRYGDPLCTFCRQSWPCDARALLDELDTLERRAEAAEDLYKIAVSEHGHDETHSADWPSCLPVHIAMNRYRAALATPAEGAGE